MMWIIKLLIQIVTKENKEFQGFVGLSKEMLRKIFANYSEDLNMACINSDIKLMIVFLLFKFIVLLFLYPGANWEFFPE